jgi:hypothetical protein
MIGAFARHSRPPAVLFGVLAIAGVAMALAR